MSVDHTPDSVPQAGVPNRSGNPSREVRRYQIWAKRGMLLILLAGGTWFTIAMGRWVWPKQVGELPEIPSVNLEGADPAIAKRVKEARKFVEQSPRSASMWGQYGLVLHAHGFADAAHVCYDAANLLDPRNPMWPHLRGVLCLEGNVADALPHFELAARLGPPGSLSRLRLAETLLELGRFNEADEEYRKVLAVEAQEPQAQLGLGRLAVAEQKYREALPYLLPAAEHSRTRKAACAMLANVHDRLGDRVAAEAARSRLAKLPPDELRNDDPVHQVSQNEVGLRAMLARAQGLMDRERDSEMLRVVEDAVHRYPESFEAWDALSVACELAGNPAGAERAARKCIQLVPKNARAWLGLGKILIGQRRFQDAMEPLTKAIALNPRSDDAHFLLGECRRELGDTAGAVAAYREALRISPSHSQARERLNEMPRSP